jgi:hypothetical protein
MAGDLSAVDGRALGGVTDYPSLVFDGPRSGVNPALKLATIRSS